MKKRLKMVPKIWASLLLVFALLTVVVFTKIATSHDQSTDNVQIIKVIKQGKVNVSNGGHVADLDTQNGSPKLTQDAVHTQSRTIDNNRISY